MLWEKSVISRVAESEEYNRYDKKRCKICKRIENNLKIVAHFTTIYAVKTVQVGVDILNGRKWW